MHTYVPHDSRLSPLVVNDCSSVATTPSFPYEAASVDDYSLTIPAIYKNSRGQTDGLVAKSTGAYRYKHLFMLIVISACAPGGGSSATPHYHSSEWQAQRTVDLAEKSGFAS